MDRIGSELAWADERSEMKTAAERALDKCKKREKALLKNGYRVVSVNRTTKIIVPCDKDGNPTEEGQERVEHIKKLIGV